MSAGNSNLAAAKAMLAEMTAETEELKQSAGGAIADVAANWLLLQYLLTVRAQLAALPGGPERLKVLRLAANDLVALQRGGHSAARLVLERERLAFDRARMKCEQDAKFWEWTKQPEIRRKLYPRKRDGISEASLRKIERELKLM